MSDASFSIVIPTYQRREIVCDAVRAVARIDYSGPCELIVVIDGSTDGTAEALRGIEVPFAVKVIEQTNAGAAAARNRGASHASGELLLFLDDDMMCEPNLLAEHARCYAEGADAVIGDFVLDEGSLPGFLSEQTAGWYATFREACAERGKAGACDLCSGQFSIRRQVFLSLGGFDEGLTRGDSFAGEDTDLGARLVRRHKLVHNPRALTRHRYVVKPSELMKRVFKVGTGAAAFLTRYPELIGEFFADGAARHPATQLVFRPLGGLPGVPRLLAAILGHAGDLILRTRWRNSRRFARLFNAAWNVAYWSALDRGLPTSFSSSVTVLCYHSIADHAGDSVFAPYGVAPERFRQQIDWLARRRFRFISPQEFLDFLDGESTPPPNSLLVTFDDCYQDIAAAVRDELAPRSISSLAFCVAGIPSNTNEWDQPGGAPCKALLTPRELQALRADGLEVGSHSSTHTALPSLSLSELRREVSESAEMLQQSGLPRPRFFAYPYGARDYVSRREVRLAGYAAAFGVEERRADRFCDRFDIPRVSITARDRGLRLGLKARAPRLYYWLATRKAVLRDRLA
jgi:glycosyltransferase involved in cell wall biosynthesis/peptidoglycan/xylan/chitin deacetylase (PgdA/CDA1 family)